MNWVEKIRNSNSLGEGSCSSVDECMTDSELREELEDFTTFEEAWNWLVEMEKVFWERSGIPWEPKEELHSYYKQYAE